MATVFYLEYVSGKGYVDGQGIMYHREDGTKGLSVFFATDGAIIVKRYNRLGNWYQTGCVGDYDDWQFHTVVVEASLELKLIIDNDEWYVPEGMDAQEKGKRVYN